MNVRILSLKRADSTQIRILEDEYIKRLKKYVKIDLVDIKRTKMKGSSFTEGRKDAKKILSQLERDQYIVLLSDKGREFTSVEFSQFIKKNVHNGIRSMTFIIGGPQGIAENILDKVDFKLSLSKMTLPHKLTRLILIEALYRSFDIINSGPYHK